MAWVDITAPANWQPYYCEGEFAFLTLFGTPDTEHLSNYSWDGTKWVGVGALGDPESDPPIVGAAQLQYVGPALEATHVRVTIRLTQALDVSPGVMNQLYNVIPCFAPTADPPPDSGFAHFYASPTPVTAGGDPAYKGLDQWPEGFFASGTELVLQAGINEFPTLVVPLLGGVTGMFANCDSDGGGPYADTWAHDIIKIEAFVAGFWTDFVTCEERSDG